MRNIISILTYVLLLQEKAHPQFSRAIFVTGCPLSLFEHYLWKEFFQCIRPLFKIPTRKTLGGTILDKQFAAVQNDISGKLAKAETMHLQCKGKQCVILTASTLCRTWPPNDMNRLQISGMKDYTWSLEYAPNETFTNV